MSDRLRDMIIRHEGKVLKAYRDSRGVLTIGFGRNLEDKGISEREAEFLLTNDILSAKTDASKFPWFENLNDTRRDVIVSMIFNMGVTRFKGFKRMIAALLDANYQNAAREMLDSAWARQVGPRATELSEMMRTGSYPVIKS